MQCLVRKGTERKRLSLARAPRKRWHNPQEIGRGAGWVDNIKIAVGESNEEMANRVGGFHANRHYCGQEIGIVGMSWWYSVCVIMSSHCTAISTLKAIQYIQMSY